MMGDFDADPRPHLKGPHHEASTSKTKRSLVRQRPSFPILSSDASLTPRGANWGSRADAPRTLSIHDIPRHVAGPCKIAEISRPVTALFGDFPLALRLA